MSGIYSYLCNYQFLNLAKSVTESQIALYHNKELGGSWKCVTTLCNSNLQAWAVPADIVTHLFVSTLRSCGFCLPPPPPPPTFPIPHDNVQFLQYATQRALWNWDPSQRKEIKEDIASCMSEKWNIFQVVGEWSFAFSLENAGKSTYYQPTFLTISEPLENGMSYRTICAAFAKLNQRDRMAILDAIYRQEPPSLRSSAKKVYQDIRAIASKLHQGNKNYTDAFSEYAKIIESHEDAPSIQTSQGMRPVHVISEPSLTTHPRSEEPMPLPVPSAPFLPAPPSAPLLPAADEIQLADQIQSLRTAFSDATAHIGQERAKLVKQFIINDTTAPLPIGPNFKYYSPDTSPKYFVARLALLRYLNDVYRHGRQIDVSFFPYHQRLSNGKTLSDTGFSLSRLSDQDCLLLRDTIIHPANAPIHLNGMQQQMFNELSEWATHIQRNPEFLKVYEALRIDLMAD